MTERTLATMAALLSQGQTVHLTALALALVVLLGPGALWLQAAALLLVGLETYLALRVGLDAQLFERLAREAAAGGLDLEAFDRGLLDAGLLGSLRESPARPRPLEARLEGAMRLFKLQALLAAGELALTLASLAS
jgi:hypothetical protein